jgi:predicted ribosome quality control (RQC) complex YloA/Tae2 family protein
MEAQYAEGMADLSSQLIDNLSSLQDIATEISETYTNALELARDEIDKTMSTLDSFNSAMESYIEIAGLQGRDFFVIDGQKITNSFKGLESLYEAQYDNNLKRVLVQKEYLDVLVEEEAYFKAKINSGEELTDLEKKQYASLREQIQDTQDGLLSATQETLDGLKTAYENTINGIAQDLDSFMSGSATSLEHLADQYAYFQEEQGRYVSTAKELFEVSKLTRDIENSIAEASTNASKEALKALQEKINKQSELNELTEYDIQMNQLQYQLLLARIQLEEAQNAKDTVRLTRDDNGNYAYQYTAD